MSSAVSVCRSSLILMAEFPDPNFLVMNFCPGNLWHKSGNLVVNIKALISALPRISTSYMLNLNLFCSKRELLTCMLFEL